MIARLSEATVAQMSGRELVDTLLGTDQALCGSRDFLDSTYYKVLAENFKKLRAETEKRAEGFAGANKVAALATRVRGCFSGAISRLAFRKVK